MVREHHKYRAKLSTFPARGAGQLPAHFARLPNAQSKHAKQHTKTCATAKLKRQNRMRATHPRQLTWIFKVPHGRLEELPSAVVTVLALCFVLVIIFFLIFFLLVLRVFERALIGRGVRVSSGGDGAEGVGGTRRRSIIVLMPLLDRGGP